MNRLIRRLEGEIERLDKNIMSKSKFDDENTVNLNGLVCLMKHAAWANPSVFSDWLKSKPADINPTIMDRFVLYDTNALHDDKNRDGVQIRVHIMREPGDDAKHNHQRSFTTMIIKGGYYYQYFVIDEDEEKGDEIEIWERIPKGDPPFEFKEKRFGNIRQVTYEDSQSEPVYEEITKEFRVGDSPIFVNSDWHHVISPMENPLIPGDNTVITIVARRGKPTSRTTFLKGPDDDSFKPSKRAKTHDASPEQVQIMVSEIIGALTGGETDTTSANSNLVSMVMKPKSGIISISEKFISSYPNSELLNLFMKKNEFTYIPILDAHGAYKGMVHRDNGVLQVKYDVERVSPKSSILDAILWTTLSENFVVPIVSDSGVFCGLLSLEDIISQIKPISQEITWQLQISELRRRQEYLTDCNNLVSSLNELEKAASINSYASGSLYKQINNVLIPLGNLLINPHIQAINVDYTRKVNSDKEWIESISNKSFVMTEKMASCEDFNPFLEELRKSRITQLVYSDGLSNNHIISTIDGSINPISPISNTNGVIQALNEISNKGNWPLFVKSGDSEDISVISIDELFSPTSIEVISKVLKRVHTDVAKAKLFEILISEEYTEAQFLEVPSLLREVV